MKKELSVEEQIELKRDIAISETSEWVKKKPEPTYQNFDKLMFANEITIRFNQMTKRIEIEGKGFKQRGITGIYEEQQRAWVYEACRQHKLPVTPINDWIYLIARAYHPVKDWIMEKHKQWDGVNRLDELFETLDVQKDKDLAKEYLRIWCLQTARNLVHDRGYSNEYVLVLKAQQGAGKTRWVRNLTKEEFIKTGLQLDPKNKDSILDVTSAWIVELGELDGTTRKADHAHLKAFLSKDYDYVRRPYGREEVKMPRKTSFIATVNNESFLVDDTGNRRYLVIEVGDVQYNHKVDMQSFWYEMHDLARRNTTKIYLDQEFSKLQAKQSEKFRQMHPIEESIHQSLDSLYKESYFTKELIEAVCGIDNPTQNDCKIAKQTMLSLGWEVKSMGGRYYVLVNPNYGSEADPSHPF